MNLEVWVKMAARLVAWLVLFKPLGTGDFGPHAAHNKILVCSWQRKICLAGGGVRIVMTYGFRTWNGSQLCPQNVAISACQNIYRPSRQAGSFQNKPFKYDPKFDMNAKTICDYREKNKCILTSAARSESQYGPKFTKLITQLMKVS